MHVSGLVCESRLCCTGIVANPVRVASIRFSRLRRSYGVQRGVAIRRGLRATSSPILHRSWGVKESGLE